jgi:hypothetical protein
LSAPRAIVVRFFLRHGDKPTPKKPRALGGARASIWGQYLGTLASHGARDSLAALVVETPSVVTLRPPHFRRGPYFCKTEAPKVPPGGLRSRKLDRGWESTQIARGFFRGQPVKRRTRYRILHWVRAVLWPLPVLTLVRAWRGTIRSPSHTA